MGKEFFLVTGRFNAWVRAILSWKFFQRVLEALGAIWLIAEISGRFAPQILPTVETFVGAERMLPLMTTLAMSWALYWGRPILQKAICIPNIDTYIRLVVGDLTRADHAVVISTSQFFNTSDGLISNDSLQDKITRTRFRSIADLDGLLSTALLGWPSDTDNDPARLGKRERFPIGTTARVAMQNGKNAYFLAMANMHPGGGTTSDIGMIQAALAGLWERLGTHGEFEKVLGIALIGSGAGRVATTRFNLFREIVDSFVAASTQRKICDELRIYLYPEDIQARKIDLLEVFDYLDSQERFPKTNYGVVAAPQAVAEGPPSQ